MTTIAIVQSCYIPWKGYFDLIRQADLFVLYDCVQYTPRDWRNRNRIKTPQGLHWLTIPMQQHAQDQRISDMRAADGHWRELHWETIRRHYARAPYFKEYAPALEQLFHSCDHTALSDINLHFLTGLNTLLGIATPLHLLRQPLAAHDDATQNLIAVCQRHKATRYLSGPSARAYLDEGALAAHGIGLTWMSYGHYREYPQLYPPFDHSVSVIDLLLQTGPHWADFL
jgi:hypothetical protein